MSTTTTIRPPARPPCEVGRPLTVALDRATMYALEALTGIPLTEPEDRERAPCLVIPLDGLRW